MKKLLIGTALILCFGIIHAQQKKDLLISGFKVEIDNNKVDYSKSIDEQIIDFEPKKIAIYQNNDFTYQVEFLFKRKGNRIKVRRISEVVLTDGTILKGNRKKEVQFMSSSAPGYFEFPVAENIVLDKTKYSTFFISYRVKVTYL